MSLGDWSGAARGAREHTSRVRDEPPGVRRVQGLDLGRVAGGLSLGLTGATRKAGRALAALEWRRAERLNDVSCCQYLTGLDRLAGSRWLLAARDTAQAARLLTWNEAWGPVSGAIGGGVFAGMAYLERVRIEDARGNASLAQKYYREFLLRYDMPTARKPAPG
jgi:hypothetical protein